MGLAPSALRFLAREHRRRPFGSPVLTLGRQAVHATYDDILRILESENVDPQPLPVGTDRRTNIPEWRGTPSGGYASDKVFFALLGVPDLLALDVSDYEQADLLGDLNQRVPETLQDRFGLVLDSGTLEHVFNVAEALTNISLMLKPGGRVVHISPLSNYANHGYYSLSPALFFDYYLKNDFVDCHAYVAEHRFDHRRRWKLYGYDPRRSIPYGPLSAHMLVTIFVAEKTATSTSGQIPIQGYARQRLGELGTPATRQAFDVLHTIYRKHERRLRALYGFVVDRCPLLRLRFLPLPLKYLGKL